MLWLMETTRKSASKPSTSKKSSEPVTVRDATIIAGNYVREVIPSASDFLVEEVEFRDGSKPAWLITLSMALPSRPSVFMTGLGQKNYKVIEVSADTGQVRSMKIKTIA